MWKSIVIIREYSSKEDWFDWGKLLPHFAIEQDKWTNYHSLLLFWHLACYYFWFNFLIKTNKAKYSKTKYQFKNGYSFKENNFFLHFPNYFVGTDLKHIQIQATWNCGSLFYNHKHHHSIVLHAVVNAEGKFVILDGGCWQNFFYILLLLDQCIKITKQNFPTFLLQMKHDLFTKI